MKKSIGIAIVAWFEIATGTLLILAWWSGLVLYDALVYGYDRSEGFAFVIGLLLLPLKISLIVSGGLVLKLKEIGRVMSLITLYISVLLVLMIGMVFYNENILSKPMRVDKLIVILLIVIISYSIYFLKLPRVKEQFLK